MLQTKRAFSDIAPGHHHHTHCLADFIVHTVTAAHRQGIVLRDFCRENTVRLKVGEESLYPDCAFSLIVSTGYAFNFVVELDNSTETVRTEKQIESWQRKLRLYEEYQDGCSARFRVLILTTRSPERCRNILNAAAEFTSNPERALFYGSYLADFLRESDPIHRRVFRDHAGRNVALIGPPPRRSAFTRRAIERPVLRREVVGAAAA